MNKIKVIFGIVGVIALITIVGYVDLYTKIPNLALKVMRKHGNYFKRHILIRSARKNTWDKMMPCKNALIELQKSKDSILQQSLNRRPGAMNNSSVQNPYFVKAIMKISLNDKKTIGISVFMLISVEVCFVITHANSIILSF